MSISDRAEPDLDHRYESIVVLFNANDEAQHYSTADSEGTNPFAGAELALHPVQASMVAVDPVVRGSTFDKATGSFVIPARTTAVFVEQAGLHERVVLLMAEVKALVDTGVLKRGRGKSLISKLKKAIRKVDRGKTEAAVNKLDAFSWKVQSLMRKRILSPEQGQPLIAAANAIIDDIRP